MFSFPSDMALEKHKDEVMTIAQPAVKVTMG
jgi:hypothetical protein